MLHSEVEIWPSHRLLSLTTHLWPICWGLLQMRMFMMDHMIPILYVQVWLTNLTLSSRKCLQKATCYFLLIQACSSTAKLNLVSDWLKGDTLGERLVMLADDLCHLALKPVVASSESSSSERWTLLSLVLSQHIKNGKHIYSSEFVRCKDPLCFVDSWKEFENFQNT